MRGMDEIHYLDSSGHDLGPGLTRDGRIRRLPEESPALKGTTWLHCGRRVTIMFDAWVEICPTPTFDGLVVYGYPWGHNEFGRPDNAVIYNADGTLRCRLRAPVPLVRQLPGYTLTPEQIAKLKPEGFWQVGWRVNEFGQVCDWLAPYVMWAEIGLFEYAYECRFFDPTTGEFDLKHAAAGRL